MGAGRSAFVRMLTTHQDIPEDWNGGIASSHLWVKAGVGGYARDGIEGLT